MEIYPERAEALKKRREEAVKDLRFTLSIKKYVVDPALVTAGALTAGAGGMSAYDLAVLQHGLNFDNIVGVAGGVSAAFGVRAASRLINRDARARSDELRLLEAAPAEVPAESADIVAMPPAEPEAVEPALAA